MCAGGEEVGLVDSWVKSLPNGQDTYAKAQLEAHATLEEQQGGGMAKAQKEWERQRRVGDRYINVYLTFLNDYFHQ